MANSQPVTVEIVRQQLVEGAFGDTKPADMARRSESPFEALDAAAVDVYRSQPTDMTDMARQVLTHRLSSQMERAVPAYDNMICRGLGRIGFSGVVEAGRRRSNHRLAWLLAERDWTKPVTVEELDLLPPATQAAETGLMHERILAWGITAAVIWGSRGGRVASKSV